MGELFLAVDLASRCIIAHCFKGNELDSNDVIKCLDASFEVRSFLPKVSIVHSDRGSLFRSAVFIEFLENRGITASRGSSRGHENQVVERLNRTIKDRIRTKLNPEWRQTRKINAQYDPLNDYNVSVEELSTIVMSEIENYNNAPHRAIQRFSPNQMEEALFSVWGSNTASTEVMLYETKSPEYREYLNKVQAEYRGDWEKFFLEWRAETQEQHKKVIGKMEAQYQSLFEQHLLMKKELEIIRAEADHLRREREAKALRKQQKENRAKQPIRDTLNRKEFEKVLDLVKGQSALQISRRRLALALLYFTGLRVSNLLVLKISHIADFFNSGKATISLIKNGEDRFPLVIDNQSRKYLKKHFESNFEALRKERTGSDLVFVNKDGEPLGKDYFDRELNRILAKASVLFEKHLRTHSFRASFITDHLLEQQVHDVQELIGHRSIASTLHYKRSRITLEQRQDMIKKRPNQK